MKEHCNLDTNEYLNQCNCRDVISFDSRDPIYISKLYSQIKATLDRKFINYMVSLIEKKLGEKCDAKQWLKDGESCEILKAGSSGWQKGKFKLKINLSLEFIPDRIEQDKSPLDDVRQEISKNNIQ